MRARRRPWGSQQGYPVGVALPACLGLVGVGCLRLVRREVSYPWRTLTCMGARDCPAWCERHSAARCRSTPVVVGWGGRDRFEVAVQLERWAGREPAVSLLLPDAGLLLPEGPAVQLVAALGGLCETAGWGRDLFAHFMRAAT